MFGFLTRATKAIILTSIRLRLKERGWSEAELATPEMTALTVALAEQGWDFKKRAGRIVTTAELTENAVRSIEDIKGSRG
jgi:hypothetical protein